MHTGPLAYESALIASLILLTIAVLTFVAVWIGARPRYTLSLSVGVLILSAYFGLLAISAGVRPYWPRAEMAALIRTALIAAVIPIGVWIWFFAQELLHFDRFARRTLRIGIVFAAGFLLLTM